MTNDDTIKRLLTENDPARCLRLDKLFQLEKRIVEQSGLMPQQVFLPAWVPSASSLGLTFFSPWRNALIACLLLILGVFVGQDIRATPYQRAVITSSHPVLAMATPWQSWIVQQEGGAESQQ